MSTIWKCPNCGHAFHPLREVVDVQCPRCGTLAHKTVEQIVRKTVEEKPLPLPQQFQSKAFDHLPDEHSKETDDLSAAPRASVSNWESAPLPSHDQTTEERAEAPMSADSLLSPELSIAQSLWKTFGPTIVASAIFLAWVIYDKFLRN